MTRLVCFLTASVIAASALSPTLSSALAEEAAQNYQTFCAVCHGSNGGGDGPGAATLPVKPRKFTDCNRMRKISDEEALAVIRNGGGAAKLSPDMPAWKDSFSPDEIRSLLRYVQSFCNQGGGMAKVEKH